MLSPDKLSALHAQVISLTWRRDGDSWRLFANRRRMGRVVPDARHPSMWRAVLSPGRLSDLTNLSRAKDAALAAAERELAFEHRQRSANCLPKPQQKGGVFQAAASPVRQNQVGAVL
jgi:hypothetical protein